MFYPVIECPPSLNDDQQEHYHAKRLVQHQRVVIPPVVEGKTDHVPAEPDETDT